MRTIIKFFILQLIIFCITRDLNNNNRFLLAVSCSFYYTFAEDYQDLQHQLLVTLMRKALRPVAYLLVLIHELSYGFTRRLFDKVFTYIIYRLFLI